LIKIAEEIKAKKLGQDKNLQKIKSSKELKEEESTIRYNFLLAQLLGNDSAAQI
jgi:hypothetical protein